MTKPIVDADARAQALNPDNSYIVQAPAGSGKTELLMQRYLVLLARVDLPEEIIAITFTRKATAEMRSRILGALQWAAETATPDIPHELKTWQLAKEVLARDQEFNWHLQENPNRLRILTIDSLSASLARQMPILSRAGVNPQTTEDATELYRQAAHATLESLLKSAFGSASSQTGRAGDMAKDIACLLGHLDNDWQKLETMLSSLLRKRDHWLRHLPALDDSEDLQHEREKLESGLCTIVEITLQETLGLLPESLHSEWADMTNFAAENLLREGTTHSLVDCAGLQQLPDASANNLHLWQAMTELLLTKDSWRKTITKTNGFPAPSSSKDSDLKQLLAENKQRMLALIENMSEIPGLIEQLCAIRELPAPAYTDVQWKILKALFNVLKLSVAQLQLVFRETGQVDFVGVNLAALDALIQVQGDDPDTNHTEPTDLALALDYRIKHLLVDEFQDTSVSQYLLLKQLTAGWEPEDGRSLFLVGDPMQSIYRFREAEVGLFLNVQQSGYLGHVRVVPIQLQVNFRSDQVVVEWINTLFAKAMPAQASVTTGAVSYSPSKAAIVEQSKPTSATVKLHPLIEPPPEAEAELVCDLIEKAQRDSSDKNSVAILVRNKSHLIRITQTLQERGLNYQAVELEALMQRSVIRDLHALTRALLHPGDRVAWLSILRAPWCGLILDDLEIVAGRSSLTILDQLNYLQGDRQNSADRNNTLSTDGQVRSNRFYKVIDDALAQRRRLPLARWIEGVWLSLGGPACLDSDNDLQNARKYFELLNQLDDGAELASFKALEHALSRLFAAPQLVEKGQAAIQLMTIHKAKGLEFDTVIIPGLQRQPRNDDRQLLQWTEWRASREDLRDADVDQDQLLLAPIEETGSERGSINQYLSTLEKERSRHEAVRLLYVAATRAKRHLHLIGSVDLNSKGELKAPDPRSLLSRIWASVEDEFLLSTELIGQAEREQNDQPGAEAPSFLPYIRRLSVDWTLPKLREPELCQSEKTDIEKDESDLVSDQPIEYLWAGAPAKHIGTVVHQLLQQITEQGLQSWEEQTRKNQRIDHLAPQIENLLKESGATEAVLPMAIQRVQASLVNMLDDDRGRWILSDQHQDARNEYALTGVLQGKVVRAILDRTFIDQQGIRWIIDYKTGNHEGGGLQAFLDNEQARYRVQLERYAQLLSKMEDRPIRLGLYFPLLKGWRAWSPE